MCSRAFRRTFPTCFSKGLAIGAPVVATRLAGIPELIKDGSTGILAAPGDAAALASAIKRVMDEPGLADSLSRRGREWVCSRFDAEKSLDTLQNLYQGVLRRAHIKETSLRRGDHMPALKIILPIYVVIFVLGGFRNIRLFLLLTGIVTMPFRTTYTILDIGPYIGWTNGIIVSLSDVSFMCLFIYLLMTGRKLGGFSRKLIKPTPLLRRSPYPFVPQLNVDTPLGLRGRAAASGFLPLLHCPDKRHRGRKRSCASSS